MKKPFFVIKKQKSIFKILFAVLMLLVGFFIVSYESKKPNESEIPVMAGQNDQIPNKTIADLVKNFMGE